MKCEKILILNDIRSVYNTASIFRIADAIGINRIFLSGTTPAPKDRFGRNRKDFHKVALGAEKSVSWEKIDEVEKTIISLKNDGFVILALEQNKKSIDYKKVNASEKVCIILGNEVDGIPPKILKLVDGIYEINMMGKKESLNVAVAFGIFSFRLLDI